MSRFLKLPWPCFVSNGAYCTTSIEQVSNGLLFLNWYSIRDEKYCQQLSVIITLRGSRFIQIHQHARPICC